MKIREFCKIKNITQEKLAEADSHPTSLDN